MRDRSNRGRALAVLAWCVAGCFSDRGLAVEIDVGDTGASSVELYVGKQHCDSDAPIACGAITPPGATAPLTGEVWFRDDLLPYTAVVKDGRATFQLRADESETIPILIAVGMEQRELRPGELELVAVGSATLRNVDVPVNRARIATATLVAATPGLPGTCGDATGDRIQVWTKATPASSCVVVEHSNSGEATRDFVVPLEDPDCDDVARPECNPTAYHGESPPGTSFPDCITSSGSQACVLGSQGCSDDLGPDSGSCAPHQELVCVPTTLCQCSELDSLCARTEIAAPEPNGVPRVVCDIPARQVAIGLELCSDMARGTIEVGDWVQGAECDQAKIGSLRLRDLATSHDFGGAILELSSPASPCTIPITWKGGTRTLLDQVDYGAIEVPFGDGALLLPVVVNFTVGCLTPLTCTVEGNPADPMWSCVH